MQVLKLYWINLYVWGLTLLLGFERSLYVKNDVLDGLIHACKVWEVWNHEGSFGEQNRAISLFLLHLHCYPSLQQQFWSLQSKVTESILLSGCLHRCSGGNIATATGGALFLQILIIFPFFHGWINRVCLQIILDHQSHVQQVRKW